MMLHTKLVLTVVTSVLITIALLFILLHVFSKTFIHGYTHVDLQQISREVEDRFNKMKMMNPEAVITVMDTLTNKYKGVDMEFFASDGSVLYSSMKRTGTYSFEEMADRFIDQPHNLFEGNDVNLMYEVQAWGKRYFLLLSVEGEALLNVQIFMYFNRYSSLPFLLIPLLLVILLPSLFVIAFIVRVNRRIKQLNLAMQQVDLNDLSVQLTDRSKDEVGQLSRLFNTMSEKLYNQFSQIQRSEESRKILISNLSHDLRTPLTSIKGYSETLQRGKRKNGNDIQRYSTIILQRAEYMDHLLNQLFKTSQLDQRPLEPQLHSSNICKVMQQIIMDYVYILEDKNIEPDIQIPDTSIWVNIDEQAIGQVIRNLIENAIHYGGAYHYLGIYLTATPDLVRISIRDRGKGIPEEEQTRIFERFYRIDKGRKSDGMGVGLSIAQEIVAIHQGRIIVESEPFILTAFTVELPLPNLQHSVISP